MQEIKSIQQANETNWMWPPIADAVETFLRRRDHADAYERVWRLIHIWEATATTLSGVATARLAKLSAGRREFLKARELLHGVAWDGIANKLRPIGQGSLEGSNNKRLDILNVVRRSNGCGSAFLQRMQEFLSATQTADSQRGSARSGRRDGVFNDDVRKLADCWRRVCDLPPQLDRMLARPVTVMQVIGFVNAFRNRFAHVPFPYDPLQEMAAALENVTEHLFRVEPTPRSHASALAGGLAYQRTLWRGSHLFENKVDGLDELSFVYPAHKPKEIWPVGPFAFVDSSKRPYILTRLLSAETGTWEYTRFRAEASAVVTHDDEATLQLIPVPQEEDYLAGEPNWLDVDTADFVPPVKQSAGGKAADKQAATEKINEAILAIQKKEYEKAISFLRRDVDQRPDYYIGWLRLGVAQREQAVRIQPDAPRDALILLQESQQALTTAMRHRYPEYQAMAMHERSKTNFRWYTISESDKLGLAAWRDAQQAYGLSSNEKHLQWCEYLERALPARLRK